MADRDLAAEGRERLEEWKRLHVAGEDGDCAAHAPGEEAPCPTARLVAAVEFACEKAWTSQAEADILSTLADR